MAKSPSHMFGQIIGNLLEMALEPIFSRCATQHEVYLDKKSPRPARNNASKVRWTDKYGNSHDLDYVFERNGTPDKIGSPVAFIEVAWRRYTKHSKNKAQEIQGAILPLVETYNNCPFIGAVIAGDFTPQSITQLQSLGFHILYFSYESIIDAFSEVGIDAHFDEDTPDSEFARKNEIWSQLTPKAKKSVADRLIKLNRKKIDNFMSQLEGGFMRTIDAVIILPLYGNIISCMTIEEAISFLNQHESDSIQSPLVKYEIQIRYSNGDRIEGQFGDKSHAIEFLSNYLT